MNVAGESKHVWAAHGWWYERGGREQANAGGKIVVVSICQVRACMYRQHARGVMNAQVKADATAARVVARKNVENQTLSSLTNQYGGLFCSDSAGEKITHAM